MKPGYVDHYIKEMERVFPMQGRGAYLRYDMNENPEGLPQDFVDGVLQKITPEFLATYPEPDRFLNKYANYIGTDRDHVVATNGSDTAIRYLLQTFGEEGKEVVTVAPSFEMYWVNCRLLGLVHKPVAYEEDLTIDVQKIVEAITDNTRICVLVNPNNPMGNVYSEEDFGCILEKCKAVGALLIVDEAYHYFYPNSFLKYALTEENVVVLRTFSKLFSLAAVRLGVIIGHPELIHYVTNLKLTFDVNSVALLFGEEILDRPELIQQLIQQEEEGKQYFETELTKKGYEVRTGKGNFSFVKTKTDAKEVVQKLEEQKVLVHGYGKAPLKDYIRVSIGSKEAMGKFISLFLSVDKKGV